MNWIINYTATAKKDLQNIIDYISFDLREPDIAKRQVGRIMKQIRLLDNMPKRFKVYDEEPFKSRGLRYYNVDNFEIFYLVNQETNTVFIVRIIYGGRDVKKQIGDMPSL